jgi:hypothetical protein
MKIEIMCDNHKLEKFTEKLQEKNIEFFQEEVVSVRGTVLFFETEYETAKGIVDSVNTYFNNVNLN